MVLRRAVTRFVLSIGNNAIAPPDWAEFPDSVLSRIVALATLIRIPPPAPPPTLSAWLPLIVLSRIVKFEVPWTAIPAPRPPLVWPDTVLFEIRDGPTPSPLIRMPPPSAPSQLASWVLFRI